MNVYGEITGALNTALALAGGLSSNGLLTGSVTAEATLSGVLHGTHTFGTVTANNTLTGTLSISANGAEPYSGEYVFTPTEQQQIVQIDHKQALHDITINPIPTNYGRITWDGTKITVS